MDSFSEWGLTKGTLVKRDDNSTLPVVPAVPLRFGILSKTTMLVLGTWLEVPQKVRVRSYRARGYDIAGSLLYSEIVQNEVVDISKNIDRVQGVFVVNVLPIR